ncbi:hypothetical protein CLF_112924 [Clonorchis sinensis]|uniref:Uncharacterized protein n=1 Tax=Clonorchis sinensis TaxID=79923 RepID=G7YXA0_CLOSI|nr:hypothetical protein CLF_112924 [Clonorchis sinensis]
MRYVLGKSMGRSFCTTKTGGLNGRGKVRVCTFTAGINYEKLGVARHKNHRSPELYLVVAAERARLDQQDEENRFRRFHLLCCIIITDNMPQDLPLRRLHGQRTPATKKQKCKENDGDTKSKKCCSWIVPYIEALDESGDVIRAVRTDSSTISVHNVFAHKWFLWDGHTD